LTLSRKIYGTQEEGACEPYKFSPIHRKGVTGIYRGELGRG